LTGGDVFVFMNNIAFGDDLTARMTAALILDDHVPLGTRIMMTEPLLWMPRDVTRLGLFRHLSSPTFYTTPVGVTTWAPSRPLAPIVYTKSALDASPIFSYTYGEEYKKALLQRPANRVPVLAR
jgi:hypothetical protein